MAVASLPQTTDLLVDGRWNIIKDAVISILNKTISPYSFQQVHHSVFQMCQQQLSGLLLEQLEIIFSSHVSSICERLRSVADVRFVQCLKTEWDEFSLAVTYIGKALLYLNNNYTCHRQTIPAMGEKLFCNVVLQDKRISAVFATCIKSGLDADEVTRQTIKELGLKFLQLHGASLYEDQIEKPFITSLDGHYLDAMMIKRKELSTIRYLGWALWVIEETRAKVSSLLGEETGQRAEKRLGVLLIKDIAEILLYNEPGSGASMVRGMDVSSLHLLAQALAKVNESQRCLEMIANTAINMGAELLNGMSQADPVLTVEELLALRDKLEKLVLNLPGISKTTQSPISRALAEVVNNNTLFGEKLALYCDAKVKAKITDTELERVAADVFGLFRLLKSKDVFEHAFKQMLAARLISSKPEDPLTHETFLIDQLRNECGDSVVNQFQIMLKDARMRIGINNGFYSQLGIEAELPCEFRATVITTGVWPEYTDPEVQLPQSMQHCMRLFRSYYLPRHNGRKLSFHTALGTVVFNLNHGGRTYELVTPTAFVNTVFCFQDGNPNEECLSLQQVSHRAKLSEGNVLQQLESLVQFGLITVSRVNGVAQYAFNRVFSHPKGRLRVRTASGGRALEGSMEPRTPRDADNSHAISIQAAIVQAIKSKKTMEHLELCECVTESMQKVGFSPSMTEIKQALEVLLRKGLLSRGSRPEVYIYEI
ncbi:cullin-like protein [Trypanosoma rangeli SC58]|uniref:Cullin-like protein n=1 Tax=Trypanosoma rangeli SC58 TaxID=429131 RepID=A0A061IZ60_TRYRA|nr:cullin-like protein [Trypanosoma rangeli SC58]